MNNDVGNNGDNNDFLYGAAKTEEDEPIGNEKSGAEELRMQEVRAEKERKEKRYFSAFKLIVGCLIFLGIIYATEVVVSGVIKKDLSQVTDGIIEIIKTLLYTLSGYLFARKENGD